ncbi:SRPBCC family protein [Arthrobacter sp. NPDC058130]|uniref:SRPBCC family protein n=1 Tax=Arthrobacter sp. NPDC058130 TaxID=3346353 RepID=UPI0036ED1D8B
MSPLFERKKFSPPAAEVSMHYVSAATAINASRRQVWDFIKPPENSVLVHPEIVRGFRSPGVEGAGEIQVFISMRDGAEHVSALEVMEEIPEELAITRTLGNEDPAARGRTSLRVGDDGATVLEHGQYFTLPTEAAHFYQYEQHYKLFCRQYVERVKAFLEHRPGQPCD